MRISKRTMLWIGAIVFLVGINAIVTSVFAAKTRRIQAAARILDEIELPLPVTDTTTDISSKSDENLLSDARSANLRRFFRKYNSPLYDHAEYIVQVADKYGLDYRLLPAIAMQESGLCRVIPDNSHNCWGWGIYGGRVTRFESYPQAIETISKGLKENYIDRGRTTATEIMQVYTPSSNGSWAHGVNTFLRALE